MLYFDASERSASMQQLVTGNGSAFNDVLPRVTRPSKREIAQTAHYRMSPLTQLKKLRCVGDPVRP